MFKKSLEAMLCTGVHAVNALKLHLIGDKGPNGSLEVSGMFLTEVSRLLGEVIISVRVSMFFGQQLENPCGYFTSLKPGLVLR